MKLITRLLAGIAGGLLAGLYAPEFVIQLLATFKGLFGQFIGYTIPLLILFYVLSGIANLERGAGKLLGATVGISYASTICAGFLAFFAASSIVPHVLTAGSAPDKVAAIAPFFKFEVAPLLSVTTALVTAFVFGIGIAVTRADKLKGVVDQGRDIIELVLGKIIIPFLPLYIASVFAGMAAQGTVFQTFKTFGLVLAIAISMQWLWLAVLFGLSALTTGRNPLKMIATMMPAYFTALGTMSSAATIPVTMRQTRQLGVSESITGFVVPLGATIHMCGSIISIVTGSTAVMFLMPDLMTPTWSSMVPFILVLGITMVAAPGVPGGAVMAALGLLTSMLGFGETAAALMIALHIAQDSFGTACNITGDGAIATLVDRIAGRRRAATAADKGLDALPASEVAAAESAQA
ncbi:dicarboxylate/amino acid:cation symporter [Laribacter hongkongensis]|uniref:dicarboxylate/amino acid:cation symporter n=1 Tax=Laribacter hongkongensis TaxID=168471 RepID=UPI001EFD7EF3|nr:dicarboxylate/amino acid:cation symporter [Laribacter hongkongensis]MCG9081324.1 dicarboxylate/amino acid:cation symporter [Laribacter hongkongensis]